MTNTTIRISDENRKRLRKLAAEYDETYDEVIDRLIREHKADD